MSEKPFLAAFKGAVPASPPARLPPRPPWWLMRQAGRYLPEYRALRKSVPGFLDLCFTPELAAEVTLQPVRRFGMDAAILFSDILVVPHALGQEVRFLEGEGPKLTPIEPKALRPDGAADRLAPVYETVKRVRAALPAEVALIGFAGAPWTVATYMVEGGSSRDFAKVKQLAVADPDRFALIVEAVVTATIDYLDRQVRAGADALQIFETWSGVLSEPQFEKWVIAPTRRIVAAVRAQHPAIPIIGFPKGAGALLPRYAQATGVDGIGLDTNAPLAWARGAMGSRVLQGNLDPVVLLAGGQILDDEIDRICDAMAGHPFVFNLGHGVIKETPPEHVARVGEKLRARQ
jgi:uroporphyrinogen decarboxylase